ncbi:polyketide cyclase [Microbacterium lushaniae]|nr:polyketide cyclase [Microbacterium lushaniae]KAA9158533.1 polyketide cyclase [Microbacterium lushaniae]
MVDVNTEIDAVTRAVRTEEVDGASCHAQSLTRTYPSPLADVWEATTTAERIARWFAPVEGDLRLGGHYQVVGNAGGTVEACSPPEGDSAAYRLTWEFGGGMSWVTVALRAVGEEATELTLTHIARAEDLPPGFWEQFGPGATGVGWDQGLLGLSLHLTGAPGPRPEDADTWPLTEEGRAFTRRAADAWAHAHIAAGADADAAARAGAATYAFYSGEEPPQG